MISDSISLAVIRRLPKYHRHLGSLLKDEITRTSSTHLSSLLGFTPSQIRQDLHNFGIFGHLGRGYDVEKLYIAIGEILGLDYSYNTVIIGAGNLGQSLASNRDFEKHNLRIKAAFDKSPEKIGQEIHGIEVLDIRHLDHFVRYQKIEVGILCTNKESAQQMADRLIVNGIKAIWNFSPTDIVVPKHIILENSNLIESLFLVSYKFNDRKSDLIHSLSL